jgi:acyl-coenzyme A thioesterase PaaI-like protein
VRPGGTWSGPSQFEIIDTVGFLLTVASLPPSSDALTIAVDTQFLRPAPAEDIVAEARMLRATGRTTTIAIELSCASADGVVAHAVASYACRVN